MEIISTSMTPEQQNIAIAEVCGWKWYRRPATGPWADKPMRTLYHPLLVPEYVAELKEADMTERQCNWVFIQREGMVPNYCGDLNAMHDAEGVLDEPQALNMLAYLTKIGFHNSFITRDKAVTAMRATASQKAEAFMRALNLWKE